MKGKPEQINLFKMVRSNRSELTVNRFIQNQIKCKSVHIESLTQC